MTQVQKEVDRVKHWRHTITLPGGVVTPGNQKTVEGGYCFGIPKNLQGKRVLDIGCSDGFYSFECERRGAVYVLAVDDFSSVYVDAPAGFHVAHEILQSKVEFRECNFMTLTPQDVGQFDVVLFLGVLYHLRHPLLALEHLAELCKEQLIIETLVAPPMNSILDRAFFSLMALLCKSRRRQYPVDFQGKYMEFYEGEEVNHDPTNWWAPSIECLKAMLRSCGFCGIEEISDSGSLIAFSPNHGTDAEQFMGTYKPDVLSAAYKETTGKELNANEKLSDIRNLSITQFSKLKQRVRSLVAKQWHQKG